MPRLRLGVVVLPPADVSAEIDVLRRAVGDPQIARVPPHLTLVPPVNVREELVETGLAEVRHALASVAPFTLAIGPAEAFLPATPVLYLAVSGDVDALHVVKQRVFRPPFSRAVEWPYVPHITVRDEMEPARIDAAVTALADFRSAFEVDRVHVLCEEFGTWSALADVVFGAQAVVGRGSLDLVIEEAAQLDPEARAFAARTWRRHDDERFGPGTRWERDPFALTARRDGRVIGVGTGWTGLGVAYLSELLVADDVRGQGVGSHLLASFESLAARRGSRRLALRTDAAGDAVRFYERHGWRVEGRFHNWLGGAEFVQLRRDL